AAGDVELDLLVESGQAIFQLFDQPLGKAFGFGDGELAEFGSGAGDGPAPELGAFHAEADAVEFIDHVAGFFCRDVDEDEVLHDGGAQLAALTPYFSARSATAINWSPVTRPRSTD